MSETGPDLSLDLAKNELVKEGNLTTDPGDDHLTPKGAQALGSAMHADLKDLLEATEKDDAITAIFQQHLQTLGFDVTKSGVDYREKTENLDITKSEMVIKDIETALTKEGLLEPEGMLGSLEGFASVAGFNELMEENGVPEEHRDMIMEWVAGFLDMLEETLGLDIGSDLRDLSFTKANGDQALDIAGEVGISLDNIGGTPGLAAFRKDFFNLNKGEGADMDFKDFFENQLDPNASQNKGTALGAVLVKLGELGDGQLTLTPSQILDLREVSAKAAVPAENGNAAQVAEHSWTQINGAENIAALEGVINGLLGEYEEAQDEFKQKNGEKPGHTLIGLLAKNTGMEGTVADILKARYDGVQAVEIAEAANTAQITLANSVQLQVAYGEASDPPGNHNASTATITLALGSDNGAPQATCAEKDLPSVLAALGQDQPEVADSLEDDKDAFLTAIKGEVKLIATIEEQSEAFSLAATEFKSAPSIAALGKLVRAQQKMLGEAFATMASSNMAKLYPVAQMKQALSLHSPEDLLAVTNVNIQDEAPTIHFNIEKGPSTLRKNATFSLSFIDDAGYSLTILPYIKNRKGDETEKETLNSSESTVIGNKIRNVFSN